MKKLFFVVVLAMLMSTVTMAQEIQFGAKGGVNFANFTGDDAGSPDMRTGLLFGGVVEIPITDTFSFQPELLYSAQGAKEKDSYEGMNYTVTIKADYLNLPLMAKYYVAEGFSIEAGPQVGFLMSAKAKGEAGGSSAEEDIKDQFKGIDFGVNFGLGYKLENGLNFGARYNLGLADIPDSDNVSLKNAVIQLSVGYFFN